jgi:hypothetical protein
MRVSFSNVTEIQEQSLTIPHMMPKFNSSGASSSGRNSVPTAKTQKTNTMKGTMTSNKGNYVLHY